MEHGQNHLECGTMLLLMHAGRDASSVIFYADGVILKYLHVDSVAEACHGLVDTVVHNFIDKMVQSPLGYVTDIHGWALAYCLEPFQYLNTIR